MRRTAFDRDHEAFPCLGARVHQPFGRAADPGVHREQGHRSRLLDRGWTAGLARARGSRGVRGIGRKRLPLHRGPGELAKVSAAMASCWGIHANITAPYLVHLSTEEQRRRWLPGVVSGETLLAIGMTEPSGGTDLANLRTTAVRDGSGWVLNGSKTFITNGYGQTWFSRRLGRRTRRRRAASPCSESRLGCRRFSRGRKLDKVGQDKADTAELFFEDVRLSGAGRCWGGRPRIHPHDAEPASGAARRRSCECGAREADSRGDHRLRPGPARVRSVDRVLPAQQVPPRGTSHEHRGGRSLRSISASWRTPGVS